MNRDIAHQVNTLVQNLSPEDVPDFFMTLWSTFVDKQRQYGNGGGIAPQTPKSYLLAKATIGCGRLATELHEAAINNTAAFPTVQERYQTIQK